MLVALLLMLLQPTGDSSAGAAPTRPGGIGGASLTTYYSAGDYPLEAIRKREQGVVGFRIEVGPDGRVASCRVIESSGSPALDAATCTIAVERFRFRPARDAEGRPTTDWAQSRIRWVLPPRHHRKR